MIDYLDLLAQQQQFDHVREIVLHALRTGPESQGFIARRVFPDLQAHWIHDSRLITYFDPGKDPDARMQETQDSRTRVPVVLLSEDRRKVIAIELSTTRTTSFRLRFLESESGRTSFIKDYGLPPDADIRLVSVTIDGYPLLDVERCLDVSIRKDLLPAMASWELTDSVPDQLLLQLPELLEKHPDRSLPALVPMSDVMGFLNDHEGWLNLAQRIEHLCRSLCALLPQRAYWWLDTRSERPERIAGIPLFEIACGSDNREFYRYDLLTHGLRTPERQFTLCDTVPFSELLPELAS